MKFLYPEFLYGLIALVIPIIIHLFNFRKAKKVYFSTIRFLKHVQESTSQKLKLKHYLILASRLLFLFFLVMAFAQPFLPSADKEPLPENVLIYLDNSQSMSGRMKDGSTGLEHGLGYVEEILKLYPKNTNYKLLTNDFSPFSNTFKTKDELEDLLTEIRYSQIARDLNSAYSRLKAGFIAEKKHRSDIYIISDFQKSTIGDLATFQPDTINQIIMLPVELGTQSNVFIDSVFLENPYLNIDKKNKLHVRLHNDGSEDKRDLQLKLFVNDIQTATTSVDIPGGRKMLVSFALNFPLKRNNVCKISFEDYPVTFDNDFFFVLKPEEKIDVLEIKVDANNKIIQDVYGNASLFRFVSQNVVNLDYSLIGQSDLVILNGLPQIDPSLTVVIMQYLTTGGVLLVIPSVHPDPVSYKQLTGIEIDTVAGKVKTTLAPPNFSNTFFTNIFEEKENKLNMPQARNVITWKNSRANLLQYINGENYLSEFRQNGIIYLLGSPLSGIFTNFHRHAIFVPVMYKIAFMRNKSYERLYYSINESLIKLKPDSLHKDQILKLKREEEELIPNQRTAGNTIYLELPKNVLSPGVYNLKQEARLIDVLAFNRTPVESLFSQNKTNDLKKSFSLQKKISIFSTNSPAIFANEIKKKKIGIPLWKYAIILALLFLLTEVFFIRLL